MVDVKLAVVPVGKLDPVELEAALGRAARILRRGVELRQAVPVPRASEDVARGQHRASALMGLLRASALQTTPGRMIGAEGGEAPAMRPDRWIFVTDVDLFTDKTDGVFGALVTAQGLSVVSVRRLREAFHRRKAEPGKQRTRLVKEVLRMAGRLNGLRECSDPQCALAASRSVADVDAKSETYCRPCTQLLFKGTIQV